MKRIVLILFSLLMFLACTRQLTEPKEFSLAGVVTISGQADFSDVTVELYAVTDYDTSVTNRLKKYPNVGLDLSLDRLFDHRLADASYATSSDEMGKFSFSKIPDGEYNLVVSKNGFGWRYVLNVNASTQLPELKLYPEMTHSGVIETYEVWPANRHIILNGDLAILAGGTLLIDKGCVVRFGGNYQLMVDGNLQLNGTDDDVVWLTANTPSKEPGYVAWRGIVVNGETFINYCRIDFAETALRTSRADYSVTNSIITRVGTFGVLLTRESTGTFENNMLVNCPTGLKIEGNSYADARRNLFIQTSDQFLYGTGLLVNTSRALVSDNIFSGFDVGCTFEFNCRGEFTHNAVDKCGVGVFVNKAAFSGEAPVTMASNIFGEHETSAVDIYISVSPTIRENNFNATVDGRLVTGFAIYYTGDKAVSFPDNYWGQPDESVILQRIDIRDNESDKEPFRVNILPIAGQPISGAGPQ